VWCCGLPSGHFRSGIQNPLLSTQLPITIVILPKPFRHNDPTPSGSTTLDTDYQIALRVLSLQLSQRRQPRRPTGLQLAPAVRLNKIASRLLTIFSTTGSTTTPAGLIILSAARARPVASRFLRVLHQSRQYDPVELTSPGSTTTPSGALTSPGTTTPSGAHQSRQYDHTQWSSHQSRQYDHTQWALTSPGSTTHPVELSPVPAVRPHPVELSPVPAVRPHPVELSPVRQYDPHPVELSPVPAVRPHPVELLTTGQYDHTQWSFLPTQYDSHTQWSFHQSRQQRPHPGALTSPGSTTTPQLLPVLTGLHQSQQ